MVEVQVKCDSADVKTFLSLAKSCQDMARYLGDCQNRGSLLELTPQEATQLAVMIRMGSLTALTAKEVNVVVALLNVAGESALMIPDNSESGLSVVSLVSLLLSSGNMLEEAANRTLKENV